MSSVLDSRRKSTPGPAGSTRSVAHGLRSPITKVSPRKAATATPRTSSRLHKAADTNQSLRDSGARQVTRSQSRALNSNETPRTAVRGSAKGKEKTGPDSSPGSESYGINQLYSSGGSQEPQDVIPNTAIPESPDDPNVSGTTLHPTDSEPETGGDVDALLMVHSLPHLQRASTAILDIFAASSSSPSGMAEVVRSLQDPKSSQSRRLQRMRSNFATQKEKFGAETYISIEQTAPKLPSLEPSSDPSTKAWHADGILYKANCAQLALEILTKSSRTDSVEESMYDLEGKYPIPFLNELARGTQFDSAGKSGLRRPTFDLALEMRTQFLMTSLVTQQDRDSFNPRGLLQHVFFNETLDTQAADEDLLRGFNLTSLQDRDGNLPYQYEEDVQDRIRDIQEYFADDGTVDFERLEARFPWEGFIYNTAKWLRSRNDELDRFLKQQPSIDDIRGQLEDVVNRRATLSQTTATPEQAGASKSSEVTSSGRKLLPAIEFIQKRGEAPKEVPEGRKPKKSFSSQKAIQVVMRKGKEFSVDSSKDFAPRLSQLAAKPAGNSTDRNTLSRRTEMPAIPSFSTDPDQTLVDDLHEDLSHLSPQRNQQHRNPQPARQPPTSAPRFPHMVIEENEDWPSSQTIMADIKSHKQKDNSKQRGFFIDRQPDARRVSPVDSQQLGIASPSTGRKRRQTRRDDSVDEYEENDRAVNIQDKRAQKPAQTTKRQRRGPGPESMESPALNRQIPWQNTESPSQSEQPRVQATFAVSTAGTQHSPSASNPANPSQPSSSQTSPPRIPFGTKPIQVRRRWTTEEDNRLVELVGKHGTSWAVIKHRDDASTDPQLTDRNQVQLKDRARNLVMIWYRGGRSELPKNFEFVSLKQKDIEELEARGIQIPERPLPRGIIRF
ncbi:hypothetical protein BGW36DRAFT_432306 [Talaromyces proteolyticus]|uniref:Myb-like domain-containing protein n=1 Tax=Talaromyces proteolyticus TaxID=1131652 RepID=A0AAD4PVL8_9EURO|nr:uncharacterized protein BGW36DRAFT_432306 [Talaromyces proteolyticus]KAH8690505.1 hypothetical protein BGW36DRAFT_432306 [Talaromyces proteolyticus]